MPPKNGRHFGPATTLTTKSQSNRPRRARTDARARARAALLPCSANLGTNLQSTHAGHRRPRALSLQRDARSAFPFARLHDDPIQLSRDTEERPANACVQQAFSGQIKVARSGRGSMSIIWTCQHGYRPVGAEVRARSLALSRRVSARARGT